jgi:hypothetical protein
VWSLSRRGLLTAASLTERFRACRLNTARWFVPPPAPNCYRVDWTFPACYSLCGACTCLYLLHEVKECRHGPDQGESGCVMCPFLSAAQRAAYDAGHAAVLSQTQAGIGLSQPLIANHAIALNATNSAQLENFFQVSRTVGPFD